MKKFKRLNTKLEATGAEFLVLGQLLIRGKQAYKSYVNHPGYDLIVVNPEKKTQARKLLLYEKDEVVFCFLSVTKES